MDVDFLQNSLSKGKNPLHSRTDVDWVMCKEGKDGSIKLQAEFKDSTIISSVHFADTSVQQLTVVLGSLYGAHTYAPEVFCWIHDRRASRRTQNLHTLAT